MKWLGVALALLGLPTLAANSISLGTFVGSMESPVPNWKAWMAFPYVRFDSDNLALLFYAYTTSPTEQPPAQPEAWPFPKEMHTNLWAMYKMPLFSITDFHVDFGWGISMLVSVYAHEWEVAKATFTPYPCGEICFSYQGPKFVTGISASLVPELGFAPGFFAGITF